MQYYQKSVAEVLKQWNVKVEDGLSDERAYRHLKTFGPNVLAHKKQETLGDIFIRQFKSPLIYILIFAALLVLLMRQGIDALFILVVIVVNAVVGTVQEGKAKKSLERLRSLTRHKALVRRGGREILISSDEVVCGDILILHEGDKVTADGRIVVEKELKIDESILTGEAYSIAKKIEAIPKEDLVIGDLKNMVFAGTSVVSGYGEAVVVATGIDSQLGKISKELLETSDVPLPLASKILKLSHFIALAVLAIAFFTLILGIFRGIGLLEIVSAVIGLSVSAIPEGLPVALTIVLAGGGWRKAKQKGMA